MSGFTSSGYTEFDNTPQEELHVLYADSTDGTGHNNQPAIPHQFSSQPKCGSKYPGLQLLSYACLHLPKLSSLVD